MSSTASATSANTVRPSADTSAKPPSTTIFCSPPAPCTVRIPGRSVVTIGACSASTPKSPSMPGTSTCSTSPENKSFSGETSSKWKLAIDLTPALADCETHGQSDNATERGHDRDVLHLTAGDRPARTSSLVAADLNAQWTQFEPGLFRPRHVTGKPANHQSDHQKRNQVGAPLHVLGRFCGELFALFDRLFNSADHVEGRLRQVVVFSLAEPFEAFDSLLQVDQLPGRAGEYFGHVEGLRQEALDLARAGNCQLVLFK